MIATPTKLRSGAWGARVVGSVREGDAVMITAKSGKSWQARIERVLWSDGEVSICATEGHGRKSRPRRASNGECMCGEGETDLLSMGYRPGQRIRCSVCGGWIEAC